MKMTKKIPTKEGHYWWMDMDDSTPCIIFVEKMGISFYGSNAEYGFKVKYEEGSFWSEKPISLPTINGKVIQLDSFKSTPRLKEGRV